MKKRKLYCLTFERLHADGWTSTGYYEGYDDYTKAARAAARLIRTFGKPNPPWDFTVRNVRIIDQIE